MPDALS